MSHAAGIIPSDALRCFPPLSPPPPPLLLPAAVGEGSTPSTRTSSALRRPATSHPSCCADCRKREASRFSFSAGAVVVGVVGGGAPVGLLVVLLTARPLSLAFSASRLRPPLERGVAVDDAAAEEEEEEEDKAMAAEREGRETRRRWG